jgi:hypothetical protein
VLLLAGLLAAGAAFAAEGGADIERATHLPEIAVEVRAKGVSDAEVDAVIDAARQKHLSAGDAHDALQAVGEAAADGDPKDGTMGAFVKAQIEAGLHGKALADAIHTEHANRKAAKDMEKAADGGPPGADPNPEHGNDAEHRADGSPGNAHVDADHGKDADHGRDADHANAAGNGGEKREAQSATHSRADADEPGRHARPDTDKGGRAGGGGAAARGKAGNDKKGGK